MTFHPAKLLASVVCSSTLLGAMAAPADACCFLDCLFGCCRPSGPAPCATYYGPSYAGGCATGNCGSGGCSTGNCGTTTYYGPSWFGSSAWSSCSPCGVGCAPCGSSCSSGCAPCGSGGCSTGECALGQSPVNEPANDKWQKKGTPKTFGDPEPANGANPMPRTKPESGLDGEGVTGSGEGTSQSNKFQSPVNGAGEPIQQTGANGAEAGESTPITPGNKKTGPVAPKIPEDNDGNGAGQLPTLNLDGKVASRAAPERKRITLKPRVAQARLVRVPAYPKSDWVPVDTDAKVAKK